MYVIGMNGPPRSGKDTLAHGLAAIIEDKHEIQSQLLALSQPMRDTVYAMLGLQYSQTHYEQNKDSSQPGLHGATIREAMIAVSEEHVKPRYGREFWNHALWNRIWPDCKVLIITDYGFQFEPEWFEGLVGAENHLTIQIHRTARTYAGDSRSYVTSENMLLVTNNGILDTVPRVVQNLYAELVSQLGWKF
jgi:hypothetical protein